MKMKILALCAVLFMACSAMHFVEPAAAVKMVDHGTKYYVMDHPKDIKVVWNAYQYNKNFMKINTVVYYKNHKGKYFKAYSYVTTIAKVTKSSVKVRSVDSSGYVFKYYKKTSLTAAQYYWRVYRSQCPI